MRIDWYSLARAQALRVALAHLSVLVLAIIVGGNAEAQQKRTATPQQASAKERSNQNTVGIVAGKSDSTSLAVAEDLTNVLDDGDNFRVLALVGKGAAQNVRDVLNLRNIDLGVNVTYADIDSTAVLVELAREEAGHVPEVSYGTHFFQDLVEAQ